MKKPICLVCWCNRHPQQFAHIDNSREVKVESCHVCGFKTQAGVFEDSEAEAREQSAWLLFRLAFMMLVIPALILYLRSRINP